MKAVGAVASAAPSVHETIARLDALAQRYEVAYQGRNVCWRHWGDDGPPLVLIHGGHGNWMHWIRNIESLSRHHAVWVPDLPGFGNSEDVALGPEDPQRLPLLINALIGTLDTLVGRNAPIDLVGFSFGGLVAAQLAVQRGHVHRMALIGPAGHGGTRRQRIDMVNWRGTDRTEMLEGLRHNLAAFMLHDPSAIDELAMQVHEAACLHTRFRTKAVSLAAGGLQNTLGFYSGPLLLLWGEHDVTAVPHDIAPQLAEVDPNREWCVVPGAGHWLQYERADDVNHLLIGWFRPRERPSHAGTHGGGLEPETQEQTNG
jgi:pimeloyl-ACP methyl ester carboxylesterase